MQQYITSKTKIWIEWSCLEYLKKTEEQENREWFYFIARRINLPMLENVENALMK